jgi:hypothetical protein
MDPLSVPELTPVAWVTVLCQINVITRSPTGAATFTAANGDTLTTSVVGQATPTTTPGVLSVVEVYTITGGTGRFAATTGSFTLPCGPLLYTARTGERRPSSRVDWRCA